MDFSNKLLPIFVALTIFGLLSVVYYDSLMKFVFKQSTKLVSRVNGRKIQIAFPIEALEFAQLTNQLNIQVFLIEPCVLWPFMTIKQQNKLKDHYSVPEGAVDCTQTTNGVTLITFGIFVDDLPSDTIHRRLQELGFSTVSYSDQEIHEGRMLHFMARKRDVVIHLVTFTPRSEFLFIHPLPHALFNISREDLRYGAFAAAFDQFKLRYHLLNNFNILFSSNVPYFLFQINYSRFQECNHELAKLWDKDFPPKEDMTIKMKETVKAIRLLTSSNLIPIWLDGGSLLGWARHCGQVPHERDADFASYSFMHNDKYDLARDLIATVRKPWYFIGKQLYPFQFLSSWHLMINVLREQSYLDSPGVASR